MSTRCSLFCKLNNIFTSYVFKMWSKLHLAKTGQITLFQKLRLKTISLDVSTWWIKITNCNTSNLGNIFFEIFECSKVIWMVLLCRVQGRRFSWLRNHLVVWPQIRNSRKFYRWEQDQKICGWLDKCKFILWLLSLAGIVGWELDNLPSGCLMDNLPSGCLTTDCHRVHRPDSSIFNFWFPSK